MSDKVKRTERGWAGHFTGGHNCLFRRNTLLEYGDKKWVVSTVGNYIPKGKDKVAEIGSSGWLHETMVFKAELVDGKYWDANVSEQISFDSPWSLGVEANDNDINNMHETVVEELSKKIKKPSGRDGV